jgi:hypothetical protein
LEIGDRLYKADPSDPSRYKEYWWNGSDWQFGSTVSGDTVPGAANLWIRRGVVDGTAPHDEVSFTL